MRAIFKVPVMAQECANRSVQPVYVKCDGWTNIDHCVEFLDLLWDLNPFLTKVPLPPAIRGL